MTVTINQLNKYNSETYPTINLAEVRLFNMGVQIPASQLIFTLSSTFEVFTASNCNDGILSDFCHSDRGDNSPTLTIYSPSNVDQIVVTNRQDNCQNRIAGATITLSQNGVQLWQSILVGTQNVYTFNTGMLSIYVLYMHLK